MDAEVLLLFPADYGSTQGGSEELGYVRIWSWQRMCSRCGAQERHQADTYEVLYHALVEEENGHVHGGESLK
jgi:hypothetical protein